MRQDYDVAAAERLPLESDFRESMMNRSLLFNVFCVAMLFPVSVSADDSHQYYEIRSYLLGDKSDAGAMDEYFSKSLIPALGKLGIGPVGAFTNASQDESGSDRVVLMIPYSSADEIVAARERLAADSDYLAAAKDYLSRAPDQAPYERIESELLVSMDCMKRLKVDAASLKNKDRVYEFRIYESANERLGDLKVDMFNNGEVPIFLDSGIQPVFIGQALVGPFTPSLSYLTVYPNEAARGEAWKAFRQHPDWQVLKKVPKYQGTVSKIYKYVLTPKPYSQM